MKKLLKKDRKVLVEGLKDVSTQELEAWVSALEQGGYTYGDSYFYKKGTYCSLGVLIKERSSPYARPSDIFRERRSKNVILGWSCDNQSKHPKLSDISEAAIELIGELNDDNTDYAQVIDALNEVINARNGIK